VSDTIYFCKRIFSAAFALSDGLIEFFSKRRILAVGFGLQQIRFIEALVFERICRKASPTFGQKRLNVSKKTLLSHLCAIIFFIFLSGCIFIPKYSRPTLPVPPRFPYTGPTTATGKPVYDIGWQDFFKDSRLQKLIELALKNNRDYRVALLNVEQLRAQYRILEYGPLPDINLNASTMRQRQLATSNDYTKQHNYQATVNISYEIDLFGHVRSLKAQALEQYLATEAASRAAQISLVAQVAVQYLTELALDEQLALLRQTLQAVESYSDLINKSFQLGNSSVLDVHLAQTQLETTKANIANYERQRDQAEDALVLLVAEALPGDLPAPQSLADQNLVEDLPVGVSSDLLERRPDILQAEHQLKSANANIGVVRAVFFPSISLTASDGTASVKLAQLFIPGSQIWSFSPQISLPLFTRSTNLANLDAAWVGKRIEVAQYEKVIQVAFKEVSDAMSARDTYNEQLKAQENLVTAQQARYNLTGARYRNGIDNYLTVLLAQQDLYSAQSNLIQVSLDRFTNLISLYKALGGGWKK
jgi:multidrug efflux system outer membrane protein